MNKRQALVLGISLFTLSCFFQSCATNKSNFAYFDNLPDTTAYSEAITNQIDPTVEPSDILNIRVATLSPDANVLFNSGTLPNISGGSMGASSSSFQSGGTTNAQGGYIVDMDGNITFPVIGKVKVAGLTQSQIQNVLSEEISKTAKEPIVNVQITNFKITVIGEVGHQGVFYIPNSRINIVEALGMAGDVSIYGQRNRVWVIHEKDGKRTFDRLDMTSKNVFSSPSFYLQQNDIVYVQANTRVKARNSDPGRYTAWSIILSSVSAILGITMSIIALSKY